jgi:hypothetical protein
MVVYDKYFTYHGHTLYLYYHSHQTLFTYFDFVIHERIQLQTQLFHL